MAIMIGLWCAALLLPACLAAMLHGALRAYQWRQRVQVERWMQREHLRAEIRPMRVIYPTYDPAKVRLFVRASDLERRPE